MRIKRDVAGSWGLKAAETDKGGCPSLTFPSNRTELPLLFTDPTARCSKTCLLPGLVIPPIALEKPQGLRRACLGRGQQSAGQGHGQGVAWQRVDVQCRDDRHVRRVDLGQRGGSREGHRGLHSA